MLEANPEVLSRTALPGPWVILVGSAYHHVVSEWISFQVNIQVPQESTLSLSLLSSVSGFNCVDSMESQAADYLPERRTTPLAKAQN